MNTVPTTAMTPRSTCTSASRRASSWASTSDLPSLRELRRAAALDEAKLIEETGVILTRADNLMTELREKMPFERAAQEAAAKWKADTGRLFSDAIHARDTRIIDLLFGGKHSEQTWKLNLRSAQCLGLLEPPWLFSDGLPTSLFAAAQELTAGLESTQPKRSYALLRQCVREVSERRNLNQVIGPVRFQRPEAARVLGATEVARLRAGQPLVLDTLITEKVCASDHACARSPPRPLRAAACVVLLSSVLGGLACPPAQQMR